MALLHSWWIVSSVLVFIMVFGFLLLESGWVERRHVAGIAIKNVMMLLASSFAYTLIGYRLMYGASVHGAFGDPRTIIPDYEMNYAWRFYQTGFASIAATIISGAMAGRTTLYSNVMIAALIAGILYPIHGHWVWHPDGWLSRSNPRAVFIAHDFAGAGVVHFVGGTAALMGCIFAGRRGYNTAPVTSQLEPTPHLAAAGVLVLLVGWFGFNGGSAVGPNDSLEGIGHALPLKVARYMQFTALAAAAGGIAAFALSAVRLFLKDRSTYLFHAFSVLSGMMGGMVAITACCDLVNDFGAVTIGILGGVATTLTSWIVSIPRGALEPSTGRRPKSIDDPVDAIAVHAGGGMMGIISVGIIEPQYIQGQLVCIISSSILVVVATSIFFLTLIAVSRFTGGIHLLRADPDQEGRGLTFASQVGDYARYNAVMLPSILALSTLLALFGAFNHSIAAIIGGTSAALVIATSTIWLYRQTGVTKSDATTPENEKAPVGDYATENKETPVAARNSRVYHISLECRDANRIGEDNRVFGDQAKDGRALHNNCPR